MFHGNSFFPVVQIFVFWCFSACREDGEFVRKHFDSLHGFSCCPVWSLIPFVLFNYYTRHLQVLPSVFVILVYGSFSVFAGICSWSFRIYLCPVLCGVVFFSCVRLPYLLYLYVTQLVCTPLVFTPLVGTQPLCTQLVCNPLVCTPLVCTTSMYSPCMYK